MLTTSTIVALSSKVAALSSNQAGLTTADFLAMGDLVISNLAAEILAAREEYLIFEETIPITSGNAMIRIPYRALNGQVRHLWYEDGTGSRSRLWIKAIESMEDYSTLTTGTPSAFFLMNNHIVLLPTPNVNGTLVIAYPFRPNDLADQSTTTTAVNVTTSSITVPQVPPNFTSGALYDIIDHRSGNGIVYYDLPATISGNTLNFTPATLSKAQVGNFIALAGTAPVPMLPEEAHSLLLEMIVLRIEMIRGNAARVKNSVACVQDGRKAFDLLLMNRVTSKAHPAGGTSPHLPARMRPF